MSDDILSSINALLNVYSKNYDDEYNPLYELEKYFVTGISITPPPDQQVAGAAELLYWQMYNRIGETASNAMLHKYDV